MIVREKDILLIIDNQKNKMLSVIFEIMDNKLYAYNLFLKDENRKKIQISKINGVEVANFLYDIKCWCLRAIVLSKCKFVKIF